MPISYYGMRSAKRVGIAVRSARAHAGVTQAALADAAGISREAVSRIENGRHSARVATLAAVLQELGLEIVFWPHDVTIPEVPGPAQQGSSDE